MVNLLLRFVALARAAGLRVSTSEVLDCLHQLELVDVLDEPQFGAVLRANFAKSRREQFHFNRLYELFFHELRQESNITHADPLADQIQNTLQALNSEETASDTSQAVLDFLGGDPQPFLERMQQGLVEGDGEGGGMGSNLGPMVRRLELMLQINALEDALDQLLIDQRDRMHWETRRDLKELFDARLESARRLLTRQPRPFDDDSRITTTHQQHLDRLGEVHFASLSKKEVETMREVIEQLVRKLKDIASRRYAVKNRGPLDVKKTLRRAAGYQGIPLELFFRNRPPRKSKIVTLCDVSGSVWSAARFMLNMLYSLQECFTQVRSFIFVAGLEEVTKIFEDCEINQAIEKVLKEANIEYNAATDYGLTFRQFNKQYMDILNQKTTLIVIGDGRSNYGNPEDQILEEMRERSRRVIWLNPETQYFWYTGDSEMRTYQACCDEVRPCQNLNQLLDFIKSLVL
ncbi:Carbon monoxide oxidation accessory protein CoxE [Olavius algarvensis Delta 1 endosymbiont]|nr:Carbon monoxide oxidation accessory protein CoxE [Olavius algarvensis Delta 1 endosymbiont]